jgi:ATP-binding cassette, subfamily C (CFTR/MRP), member 1
MSGLDAKTASLVTTRLFGAEGHFRRAGISVVLATHSRKDDPYVYDSGFANIF